MVIDNNKDGKKLRSGYTTGTCAAAAAQAALKQLLELRKQKIHNLTPIIFPIHVVAVDLPQGGTVSIPIKSITVKGDIVTAEVIKDAGDDPDITNGTSICASVEILEANSLEILEHNNEIILLGGKGVGRVTKPGLSVPVGEPAINPVPRRMIIHEVKKLLPRGKGVKVTIAIPEGERLAKKTLNPRLGIVGGISILGTTGIVRPMSEEAYVDSLIPQIDQAAALGHSLIVLTPGGMGEKKAVELGMPREAVVQTSNFIGTMLKESAKRGIKGILLFGHIGKIIKVAGGIFHTHSKIADGRREILAAHAAMMGASPALIKEIMELNTIDASIELIKSHGLHEVYNTIARWASKRSLELLGEELKIGTVMYSLDGEIIGYDEEAVTLGRELGWQV
ncbi:cobalt-precorrin-5B (C(1))-methyltransferase CbiD [Desulfitibacter alkalitolerans]|uniref:cobalt-precorrin-5B (C(1))-methyltransferase CbiD n=1 Tax=Desulfitibacter alkalitolerans TaxID=264641 RepID=UPI000A4F6959|nr:cobalt-precorrin-5B (C(1))-methyltransferase CbiD [Desulfitibacter alkalitolerans]